MSEMNRKEMILMEDDITRLTVHELVDKLNSNELTSEEITKAYIDRINEKEKDVNAFVTLTTDTALEKAKEMDKKRYSNNAEFSGNTKMRENLVGKNNL